LWGSILIGPMRICLIFLLGGVILIEQGRMIHDQNAPRKSMILSMKNRKAGASESPRAESDAAEFEALFMEHWARVYRLLYRIVGDPAEAEDLALEAFIRLHQRSPALETGFNPGGWLHRVATNLGLQSIRTFKRRERYELSAGRDALEVAPDDRPAELLAREEERRLARLALARMDKRRAELLVMRHSGLAYKEIARALGLSPASIGPLLLRAEREFEKHYRALAQEER
jgi:RNA polymerase sigma-70 factor (ECF subfamily)